MNKNEWDGFLRETSPDALFQSWDWGEVEKKLGHKVWRLEWPDAIAQVVKVEARRGTFLHVRHGPIGKIHVEDLKDLAKKEGAWFVRISPRVTSLPDLGFVPAPIHEVDAERCWVLDLNKSEEDLLMSMRKTTRYEIRHSSEVKVEKSKDIKRFIRLYAITSERHNFVKHTGIAEEFETLECDLFIASHKGADLAAAIIIYFGNQAIYHHGASIPSKAPASYLLQWEAIREAKKRGMLVYNFYGVAPENKLNHPWRGITLFKKGFGGREINYIHSHDLPVSPLYIIPRTVESIRTKLRGY